MNVKMTKEQKLEAGLIEARRRNAARLEKMKKPRKPWLTHLDKETRTWAKKYA